MCGLYHGMALSVAIQICAINLSSISRVEAGELQSEALSSRLPMAFSNCGQSHLESSLLEMYEGGFMFHVDSVTVRSESPAFHCYRATLDLSWWLVLR